MCLRSISFILVFGAIMNKLRFGIFGLLSVFAPLNFSLITKPKDNSVRRR